MKPTAKYASRPQSEDPRDVEAWALAEAARRLIDASRDPEDTDALQAALQLNQRLWTIFQAAITEPDCQMPDDLRTNVAALSLLVDRETMARLADLDASKLDTLININRNVSSGLATRIEGAPTAAAQPGAVAQHAPMGMMPPQAPMPPRPAAPAADAPQLPREGLRISI